MNFPLCTYDISIFVNCNSHIPLRLGIAFSPPFHHLIVKHSHQNIVERPFCCNRVQSTLPDVEAISLVTTLDLSFSCHDHLNFIRIYFLGKYNDFQMIVL